METYSQVGQDIWVREMLPGLTDGSFIDIGCCHPIELSNTYALEQAGWRGLLVDTDENAFRMCREQRASQVVCGDGALLNWSALVPGLRVDYLSLDCDAASLDVLRAIIGAGVRFRVATVEHDAYRFGDGPRSAMRELLTGEGYVLARPDVVSQGCAFEDWWTAPGVWQ